MTANRLMVLNSGGLRSLVATAMAVEDAARRQWSVLLLHIADGRSASPMRLRCFRRQVEHFRGRSLPLEPIEIQARHLASGNDFVGFRESLLVTAMAQAARRRAEILVYPAGADQQHEPLATLHEAVRAAERLIDATCWARVEPSVAAGSPDATNKASHTGDSGNPTDRPVTLETPLLDLADAQIIELGDSLGVPWAAAWTCARAEPRACGRCEPCQRRHRAFRLSMIADPQEAPPDLAVQPAGA